MSTLEAADRETFAKIADYLIPEAEGMPAASAVGVPDDLLDTVLKVRQDIQDDFLRGVRAVRGMDGQAAANELNQKDARAFQVISLAASAGYYMAPRVRELIGYPGQESRPFDPNDTTDYLDDGLLQPVIDRGAIYRPTPGLEARAERNIVRPRVVR